MASGTRDRVENREESSQDGSENDYNDGLPPIETDRKHYSARLIGADVAVDEEPQLEELNPPCARKLAPKILQTFRSRPRENKESHTPCLLLWRDGPQVLVNPLRRRLFLLRHLELLEHSAHHRHRTNN